MPLSRRHCVRLFVDADDFETALGLAWAALLVGDDLHEALLTDEAAQLARAAATLSGYPPETEAVAATEKKRLGADTE